MDFMKPCLRFWRSLEFGLSRMIDLEGLGLFTDAMATAFTGIDASVHACVTGEERPIRVMGILPQHGVVFLA